VVGLGPDVMDLDDYLSPSPPPFEDTEPNYARLQPGRRLNDEIMKLNDEIMNAYLQWLRDHCSVPGVELLLTTDYTYLRQHGSFRHSVNWNEVQTLVIPVYTTNHWHLAILRANGNGFDLFVLDSLSAHRVRSTIDVIDPAVEGVVTGLFVEVIVLLSSGRKKAK